MNVWQLLTNEFDAVTGGYVGGDCHCRQHNRYPLTDKGRMISLHPITDPAVAMRNSPMMRAVYLTLVYIAATGPIGPTAKCADHSRFRAKRN